MTETVYRRRGLSWLYYFFAAIFVPLGVLLVMAGIGYGLGDAKWSDKWPGTLGFMAAGVSWLAGIPSMWSLARSYGGNVVRVDGARFQLHTPTGKDLEFALTDVREVRWNPSLRVRLCTVETATVTFRFDARACPHVGRIARLIAGRAGKVLQLE